MDHDNAHESVLKKQGIKKKSGGKSTDQKSVFEARTVTQNRPQRSSSFRNKRSKGHDGEGAKQTPTPKEQMKSQRSYKDSGFRKVGQSQMS